MEEEKVLYDQELANLNMQENTFPKVNEKEDGIGEVKETDEFYQGEEGVE
jgi:hypothetical protein